MTKPKVAFICVHNSCRSAHYEDWGLEDPTGQGDEVFKNTIELIEHNILRLKEFLI